MIGVDRPTASRCMIVATLLALAGGCQPWRADHEATYADDGWSTWEIHLLAACEELLRNPASRDDLLLALDRSLAWLADDARSATFFDSETERIATHAATRCFRNLIAAATDAAWLARRVRENFLPPVAARAGGSSGDDALFTAYYAAAFEGVATRTPGYDWPLYAPPPDLARDERTGEVIGRRVGDRIEPLPTREMIEREGLYAGMEVGWLRDPFDAYVAHVNGSVRLRGPDGATIHLAHAGTNGRPYTSIGRQLIESGVLPSHGVSLQAIRAFFDAHPDQLHPFAWRNQRYVFFEAIPEAEWPRSGLGITLVEGRSVATDKRVYPPGGPMLVRFQRVAVAPPGDGSSAGPSAFLDDPEMQARFVVDHDRGGAILGPNRIDLYAGAGDVAGDRAGRFTAGGFIAPLIRRTAVTEATPPR